MTDASDGKGLATYNALSDLTTCWPYQTFLSVDDWRTYVDDAGESESWKAYDSDCLCPLANRVELFATAVNAGVFDFNFVRRASRALLIDIWEDDDFKHMVEHKRSDGGATIFCEFEALVERLRGDE